MEMDQLYTELILEHNQDKRNKRELSEFTASEHGHSIMFIFNLVQ